jgi:hypothetical protein
MNADMVQPGGPVPLMVRTAPDSPSGAASPVGSLPANYVLHPCAPNPFNSATRIAFDLPAAGTVSLAIFDLNGRQVATLAQGSLSAGPHSLLFEAGALPSGTYFYELRAGAFRETRKMLLLK